MKEKNQKPTRKKLRDERKKGKVSKSKEIATCATIVVLFVYLWIFAENYLSYLGEMIIAPTEYYDKKFLYACTALSKKLLTQLIVILIPFALCASIVTVLSYMLQFGVIFASEPIKPDFNRINPVQGFKRIFSLKSLVDLIKSILKILLLGSILYFVIKTEIKILITLPDLGVKAIFPVILTILGKLMIYVSVVFIFFAIVDYFFEKKLFLFKMKMTKDEIKREYKDIEGDPEIKGQRRRIQRRFALSEDWMSKIETSTVIIVDSDNIAIVIYYERGKTKLPVIKIKSRYLMAKRTIEISRKYEKPIIEDSLLAKKLYEEGVEGEYIRGEVLDPLATIIRSVYFA
jgi:type III secretion protein U